MASRSVVKERDDRVWSALDETPHMTARDIADEVGISVSLAHQSLGRLSAKGLVKRDDPKGFPYTWSIVHPASDDEVRISISYRDAGLIVHLLRWLVCHGHSGEPTEQLIARIEAELGR